MKDLRVRDAMSSEVATLRKSDQLRLADDLMQLGRSRHMPVLDHRGDDLVGVLSQRDLFRGALARALGYGTHAQDKLLGTLTIADVMTNDPVTTTPDTLLADAAQLMIDRKIGCLPVVENGALVGILTETDFLRLAARDP
jgi:CBS domain-containing protein